MMLATGTPLQEMQGYSVRQIYALLELYQQGKWREYAGLAMVQRVAYHGDKQQFNEYVRLLEGAHGTK